MGIINVIEMAELELDWIDATFLMLCREFASRQLIADAEDQIFPARD